jgi:hypothetical protein
MPKRTSLQDTKRVETADDLDDMVQNKRGGVACRGGKGTPPAMSIYKNE